MRIGLDAANGSAWTLAKAVFDALGAKTYVINASPDVTNINTYCGSTHIEGLQDLVKREHLDAGFAFDGDADRLLVSDENGNVVDGDKIMLICAEYMKERGISLKNTLVTTVMTNLGLVLAAKEKGINIVQTQVGDRYVLQKMLECGYILGGEASGHMIFLNHNTTGDGLVSALQLLSIMKKTGKKASELAGVFNWVLRGLARLLKQNGLK